MSPPWYWSWNPPLDAVSRADASAPRGSARRATHDELDRKLPPGMPAGRVFDQVDGEICCLLPQPRERLADRRERRRDERGDEAVVEPDHRDVGRYVAAELARSLDHAQRDEVVRAEDRGHRLVPLEQRRSCLPAGAHPVGVRAHDARTRQSMPGARE